MVTVPESFATHSPRSLAAVVFVCESFVVMYLYLAHIKDLNLLVTAVPYVNSFMVGKNGFVEFTIIGQKE